MSSFGKSKSPVARMGSKVLDAQGQGGAVGMEVTIDTDHNNPIHDVYARLLRGVRLPKLTYDTNQNSTLSLNLKNWHNHLRSLKRTRGSHWI